MVNAAIVGLGWWGKNLVSAVQGKSKRLRFVHGVSQEPDSVRDFAARRGLRLSSTLDEALADTSVQAVVLATPHSQHPDQVVAAAKAGRAVFCEKPLAFTKADAVRAVDACRRAGVRLGIGTNKRFWPSLLEMKRLIASGELGDLLHIEGHYSNENSGTALFSAWRDSEAESPGGGMTGAGLHMLDSLLCLAGPLRYAHGRLVARKPQPDPHDTVSVLLEFRNGMTGTLAIVRATPYYWRLHVFGRKGSAEMLGETEVVVRRSGAKPATLSFEPVDSLLAELEAFADAVSGERPYPVTTDDMVATVEAFEAIIQSIRLGQPVQL